MFGAWIIFIQKRDRCAQYLQGSTPWRAAAPPHRPVLAGRRAEDLRDRDLPGKPATPQQPPPCKAQSIAEELPGADQVLQGGHNTSALLQAATSAPLHTERLFAAASLPMEAQQE